MTDRNHILRNKEQNPDKEIYRCPNCNKDWRKHHLCEKENVIKHMDTILEEQKRK
tara:strand:- start:231 stop:395 length:165 start_codon:yes stop_codon:yes gene_type:complete